MGRSAIGLTVLVWALAGCGDDAGGADAAAAGDAAKVATPDAGGGGDAGSAGGRCKAHLDCSDGVFCNGVERCLPGEPNADARGCLPPADAACISSQQCDEAGAICRSDCAAQPDADRDGHKAVECGGDDCDDADPNRFPGNLELCDTGGHDEDCNPDTYGARDRDGDGAFDRACCNRTVDGHESCGTDCDDDDAARRPGQLEFCDELDNDCDGEVDEEMNEVDWFEDGDGDGFAAPEAASKKSCTPLEDRVLLDTDCDDADAARNPAAPELCDDEDNNCNDEVDESPRCMQEEDTDCDGGELRACLCINAVLGLQICGDDGTFEPCVCSEPTASVGEDGAVVGGAEDGVELDVPPAALSAPISLTIEPTTDYPKTPDVVSGTTLDFGPDGTVFDEPVTMTIYYDPAALPAGLDPSTLRIHKVVGDGWKRVPGGASVTNRNSVTASVNSFSTYGVVAGTECDMGFVRVGDVCKAVDGGSCMVDGDCEKGHCVSGVCCATACNSPAACQTAIGATCAGGATCSYPKSGANATAELCNEKDDDCDEIVDEGNPGGGAQCGMDVGVCAFGVQTCTAGSITCVGNVQPSVETCNDLDDDCDGTIDEGDPGGGGSCGTDMGECSVGTLTCSGGTLTCVGGVQPAAESCNDLDDDCDGTIDEGNPDGGAACGNDMGECLAGTLTCVSGSLQCTGGSSGGAELCDGYDNDCDDLIDEGNPGGSGACGVAVGQCAEGTQVCQGGILVCQGAVDPQVETCNNLDDDCDGVIDETLIRSCGANIGECTMGTQVCVAGSWGSCMGAQLPTSEACNALDDDCDGVIDEGNPEGGGGCGSSVGACSTGTLTCQAGMLECLGAVQPQQEYCNNVDDDCDTFTDEGDPGGGGPCGATDRGECAFGTFTCSGGTLTCLGEIQAVTDTCDGLDNDCDDLVDEGTEPCDTTGGSAEYCDGGDNDGDGLVDEGDPGGGSACGTSLGECAPGIWVCSGGMRTCNATGPTAEICDNLDNDCDSLIDETIPSGGACGVNTGECSEGVFACVDGNLSCAGETGPVLETCDMLDNDCDGLIDETIPSGGPCGVNTGTCSEGSLYCSGGSLLCVGEIAPTAEGCDDLDNDCDAVVDENLTRTCGSGVGQCTQGTETCVGGAWSTCTGQSPSAELCNSVDDDCDAVVDEGNPEGGTACGSDIGECSKGTLVCASGQLDCVGDVAPTAESCDGMDNDCDAVIDEDTCLPAL